MMDDYVVRAVSKLEKIQVNFSLINFFDAYNMASTVANFNVSTQHFLIHLHINKRIPCDDLDRRGVSMCS